jgi:hypothetical protein
MGCFCRGQKLLRRFEMFIHEVDIKAETKSCDRKYFRDSSLLNFFIGTKNKVWDIYKDQKLI